jgi:hypothetical protein
MRDWRREENKNKPLFINAKSPTSPEDKSDILSVMVDISTFRTRQGARQLEKDAVNYINENEISVQNVDKYSSIITLAMDHDDPLFSKFEHELRFLDTIINEFYRPQYELPYNYEDLIQISRSLSTN